jgi:hypothetical protein
MNFGKTNSHVGFAFLQTGVNDSMARFLSENFGLRGQTASDMLVFLLCLNGSGFPAGSTNAANNPPPAPARDVAAAVGKQVTIATNAPLTRLDDMLKIVQTATDRVDIVV